MLLLDEPLGALDAKLRKALQLELKAIQEEFGITFVYVTHDQEEALTMSDRIAVMSDGHVEQVATPREMYEEPQTVVRRRLPRRLEPDDACTARPDGRRVPGEARRVHAARARAARSRGAATTRVVIRPERVRVEPYEATGENRVPGMIERVVYLGASEQLVIRLATGDVVQALVVNDGTPRD